MSSMGEGHTPPIGQSADKRADRSRNRRRFERIKRAREKARQRRALDLTWRAGVFMIGIAIVAAGLVMFITPGPGWVVVIVGLAVLATEYVWAERILARVRLMARATAERALDPRHRRRNQTILALGLVVVAVAAYFYLQSYGFGLPG